MERSLVMNTSVYFVGWMGLLLQASSAFAGVAPCGPDSTTGSVCSISILGARPTQFSVGMGEVREKQAAVSALAPDALKKFLKKHTIPTVVGPHHAFFMTDHHHLARALLEAGVDHMNLDIQGDDSGLSETEFWAKMEATQHVYLYDENGRGPLSTGQLPSTVALLADDVYRSLAWSVQKQTSAYADTNAPYASFLWANFFRTRISRALLDSDFAAAVQEGARLARSPEAASLPGYQGASPSLR